jgi:hydrogenase expression/formation protein HypE
MCGARPSYISLSFILEEGLRMEEFWNILVSIKYACQKADVKVVTGDTKVVEKGKGDKIFINTSGIGRLHPKAQIDLRNIKKGDHIIVSGQIATHGIAILSVREGLEFETSIESDTCNLNHDVLALLDNFGENIHLMRDPTRGGLSATLNEIAKESRLGIEINEKDLPIDYQVKAACEILGLDPLETANEGLFLAIVDQSISSDFVNLLKSLEHGKNAAIIGEVTDANVSKVVIKNAMGGKRVVNMPLGEQLPRIC